MKEVSSKYYGENGIHRVPLWRIAGFSLNNQATNFYMMLMTMVSYYLTGFVGVLVITASSFSAVMRIWDGVTDPIIGYVVDKTNGKWGKNRPFMVIGNAILFVSSFIMFHVTHLLPEKTFVRFAFFIVVALIYYVGYTFQCVVTKSAQPCLTNDPKQRPKFAVFDNIFMIARQIYFQMLCVWLIKKYGTYYSTELFHDMWLITALLSIACTVIAVISIAPKDREEFYGTGKVVKVGLKDYWETMKGNRAIQMLMIAASTDKLANQVKTSTVNIVLIGVIVGDYAINGTLTMVTSVPTIIITIIFISTLATKLGQKKALVIGSAGSVIFSALLVFLWVFGNPSTMSNGNGKIAFGMFTVLYILLTVVNSGFTGMASSIVIPMTADCADYEVYRSGKYVPGLIGTLFSFVDKLVSSLSPLIAGVMYAAIGFKDTLPDVTTPYSTGLLVVSVFLMYGITIIGVVANLIAMHFYPLNKEKMEEIQEEIAAIKARDTAE